MEITDATAISQARAGDPHAFCVLVERHSRALFRLAYRMTGNEQDAEDLVQETFLRAFKQLHLFDGRAAFSTWLYRIAANCSLDFIRAREKRRQRYSPETMDAPAPDPSPERIAQSGEIADLIGPALAQLSHMERTAFVLRHYEGLGTEEIGRALGVQSNAAKHSIFRAVQKLRLALEPALRTAR